MAPLVPGWEDVVHAPKGKGGAVPDRIYPGDRPPSLRECLCPGPLARLRPLHGAGLPAKHLPDGTQVVHREIEEVSSEAADRANAGGRRINVHTEGRPESEGERSETEQMGCSPGQNISWGQTAVSSGMSLSGTLGTTQTTTWCWVACQAPP